MIQEQELLLKTLCEMLPYKPMVNADDGLSLDGKGSDYTLLGVNANKRISLLGLDFDDAYATHKEYMKNIKPYLRPMESMTKEERITYNNYINYVDDFYIVDPGPDDVIPVIDAEEAVSFINWLLSNYFDVYKLIPKGLALPAPEGMYNLKN